MEPAARQNFKGLLLALCPADFGGERLVSRYASCALSFGESVQLHQYAGNATCKAAKGYFVASHYQ